MRWRSRDLVSGFPLDGVARGPVAHPQGEQLLDFVQRKAQLLGVLDEAEPADRVVGVLAVARRCAPRGREHAAALVVTDRLNVHVGRGRDLADGERHE